MIRPLIAAAHPAPGRVAFHDAGAGRMKKLIVAAMLLGFPSAAWTQPDKNQPQRAEAVSVNQAGRSKAASKRTPTGVAAVRKPATVKLQCDYADFEFDPDGDTADVVDRTFTHAPVNTVADVRSSPSTFVITWTTTTPTLVGPETRRNRYLIKRETGEASIQIDNELPGTPTINSNREQRCTISS